MAKKSPQKRSRRDSNRRSITIDGKPLSAKQIEGLIVEARGGSVVAFGRLMDACRAYLLFVANASLPAAIRAKCGPSDLVQETALEALRDLVSFQGERLEELLAWLRKILLHNASNAVRRFDSTQMRKRAREKPLSPESKRYHDLTCSLPLPVDRASSREERELLDRALARLPQDMRLAIVLRNQEYLSFGEIAARLDRTPGAAKKLWARAIERLRQELGMRNPEPDGDDADELFAEHLAAHDTRLAVDGWTSGLLPPANEAPAELVARLNRATECLLVLEHIWPRARASEWKAPRRIGRFRVVRPLGRGGHAQVYLAHDPKLERKVALKVQRPEALASPTMRDRFSHEAWALAQLQHSGIATLFETGEAGVRMWMAIEYCAAGSLSRWILRRADEIALYAAVGFVAQLAEAVGYIHRQGIVHCDIKPSNVALVRANPLESPPGNSLSAFAPKLIDFGLACSNSSLGKKAAAATVQGTPAYMSPEQALGRGSEIGPATDIHGLGLVLYELLVGQPAFSGANDREIREKIIRHELLPPREIRPQISKRLEAICQHALAAAPQARYSQAADLAEALRALRPRDCTHRAVSPRAIARRLCANPRGWLRGK